MRKYWIFTTIILMLIFANFTFSEEFFPENSGLPALKHSFQPDPEKFTFAIIGDKTGGGEENWPIFDRAIAEANLLNPDFAITVGDHIQGYATDAKVVETMWNEYMEHLSKLKMPVFFVPGNHDISNTIMYNYWKEKIGKTYYSFDYKGCHFIAINTEEYNAPEGAVAVEKSVDFITNDIQKNKNARHIFIYMHRPLWLEDENIWKPIESALEGSKYDVFAGHYHNLTYETRNGNGYYILSATGGSLEDRPEVPKLGSYHHFSIVSVEEQDANLAIIQPGKILPGDASTREFKTRIEASLPQFKPEMPVPGADEAVNGKLFIILENKVDESIRLKVNITDAKGWEVKPGELVFEVNPGDAMRAPVEVTFNSEASLNPPKYTVEEFYGDVSLAKYEGIISLIDTTTMRTIDNWTTGELFDIPDVKGKNPADAETAVYNYYPTRLGPEMESQQFKGINTVSASKKGLIDLGKIHDRATNYVITYAQAFIYSPADITVWGAIMADDVASVFVNGRQVGDVYRLKDMKWQYEFFPISLKSGWNPVMVKCADVADDWNFTFGIGDPESQLKFSIQTRE